MKYKLKKTILIDLDGVLNTYNGKYDENIIPPIRNGAKEFLEKLAQDFVVKIFTTRDMNLTKEWLKSNKINIISDVTNKKEPAILMIDDRAVTFKGDYEDIYEEIKNFKVWYK